MEKTVELDENGNLKITETTTTITVSVVKKEDLLRDKADLQANLDFWTQEIPKVQAKIQEIDELLLNFEQQSEPENETETPTE